MSKKTYLNNPGPFPVDIPDQAKPLKSVFIPQEDRAVNVYGLNAQATAGGAANFLSTAGVQFRVTKKVRFKSIDIYASVQAANGTGAWNAAGRFENQLAPITAGPNLLSQIPPNSAGTYNGGTALIVLYQAGDTFNGENHFDYDGVYLYPGIDYQLLCVFKQAVVINDLLDVKWFLTLETVK